MTGGTVAVIGEQAQVRGYALAGAVVFTADGAERCPPSVGITR